MHLPDIIDTNFLAVDPKELVGFAVAPGWVEALFGWGLRMQIGGRRSSACKVSLTPARGLGKDEEYTLRLRPHCNAKDSTR